MKAWETAAIHDDIIRLETDYITNLSNHYSNYPNLKVDLEDVEVFNSYKSFQSDLELSYDIIDDVNGNSFDVDSPILNFIN